MCFSMAIYLRKSTWNFLKVLILVNQERFCRLKKSFYGLWHASRQWYEKLSHVLLVVGFVQSQLDFSLFTKKKPDGLFTALLIYVDDMLLTENDHAEINLVKKTLDDFFSYQRSWPLEILSWP